MPPFSKDRPSSVELPPSSAKFNSSDGDLTMFLNAQAIGEDELFSEALQLLDSLKSSPSCNRLAASKLLSSCQAIEGHAKGTATRANDAADSLENVKSLYAARLAICELVGAGAAVPEQCSTILAVEQAGSQHHLRASGVQAISSDEDIINSNNLESCFRSLESRPQWWTSYSNSRQNAVVMCHAVRVEIEKADLLELHRSITKTTSGLSRRLSQALQKAASQSAEQQAFLASVEALRLQLLQNMEEDDEKHRDFLNQLAENMRVKFEGAMTGVETAMRTTEVDMAALTKTLRESNTNVLDMHRNVHRILQDVVTGSSELAASQTEDLEANKELALSVRQSLESIRSNNIVAILTVFGNIHSQLQATDQLVNTMHQKQESLDLRLGGLDQSFGQVEARAQSIHATQVQHAEVLEHLQGFVKTDVKITRALLDEVTTLAANLQASIEETTTEFAKIAGLGSMVGFFTGSFWFCLAAFALSGLIWVFHPQLLRKFLVLSVSLSVLLSLSTGFRHRIQLSALSVIFDSRIMSQVPLLSFLPWILAAILLTGVGRLLLPWLKHTFTSNPPEKQSLPTSLPKGLAKKEEIAFLHPLSPVSRSNKSNLRSKGDQRWNEDTPIRFTRASTAPPCHS